MKGIRVCRQHRGPIVRRRGGATSIVAPLGAAHDTPAPLVLDTLTDFEEFFSSLYPAIARLPWLIVGALFSFPEEREADFGAEVIAGYQDCCYVGPGFVERWARYLNDDWCTIVGLEDTLADPDALVRANAGQAKEALLSLVPEPVVAFCCVDGVLWELYARDGGVVDAVRERLSSRLELRLDDVTVGERS